MSSAHGPSDPDITQPLQHWSDFEPTHRVPQWIWWRHVSGIVTRPLHDVAASLGQDAAWFAAAALSLTIGLGVGFELGLTFRHRADRRPATPTRIQAIERAPPVAPTSAPAVPSPSREALVVLDDGNATFPTPSSATSRRSSAPPPRSAPLLAPITTFPLNVPEIEVSR